MSQVDETRRARAFLLRAAEPPAPHIRRLVSELGPVDAARTLHERRWPGSVEAGHGPAVSWRQVDDDLALAAGRGFRLVTPEDDEWPVLRATGREVSPPLALWVRGTARLRELADRSVSIVGARAATTYGEGVAGDLAYQLGQESYVVWSGAAYGIDAAAHRGALAAKAPTVAVLGCGLDVDYPAGHRTLITEIAASGAVISEYPPQTPPARLRFLARNRLLALLPQGVVVVEAGRRSGVRSVVRSARTLGRPVCAVPGPITSVSSAGCHELIQQGAELVTSCADVQHVLSLARH